MLLVLSLFIQLLKASVLAKLHQKQVDITISKNQVMQILYLVYSV